MKKEKGTTGVPRHSDNGQGEVHENETPKEDARHCSELGSDQLQLDHLGFCKEQKLSYHSLFM